MNKIGADVGGGRIQGFNLDGYSGNKRGTDLGGGGSQWFSECTGSCTEQVDCPKWSTGCMCPKFGKNDPSAVDNLTKVADCMRTCAEEEKKKEKKKEKREEKREDEDEDEDDDD